MTRAGGRVFASLALPEYRRYFVGVLVSNIGTWMVRTAMSWLVLVELTDRDMTALGLLTGLMFTPALLLSAWAGTLADRLPKKRVMMAAQAVMLVDAAVLGLLILTGRVELWMVYAITVLDGVAGALDGPSRQAFVSEVVGPDALANAIGLNSASFNAARLIGPGVAGVLIAAWGTGLVFLVNAVSFGVLIVALAGVRVHAGAQPPRSGRKGGLREGLRYVRGRPDVLLLLVVAGMMGNFGFNFAITNPVMSVNVFERGPGEFGLLGTLMGAGALAAALRAAGRERPRVRYVLVALAAFAAFSGASAVAPTFEVFALLMVPIGFAAVTTMVTANTLIQVSVDPRVRGRVMALWMLVLMGGAPAIGPLIGWIGATFGPRWTVGVGVVAIAATAVGMAAYLVRADTVRVRLAWQERRPRFVVTRGLTEELEVRDVR